MTETPAQPEAQEGFTSYGTLHAWGGTFTVSKIAIALQVSETTVLTSAALVDVDEAVLFSVTHPEKFTDEEALYKGIQDMPNKAVRLLHDRLIEEGLVLTNSDDSEEGDSDD